MSRNNKNAREHAKAKTITAMHQRGEKGPAKTTPQHGKKNAWFQKLGGGYAAFIAGGKKKPAQEA